MQVGTTLRHGVITSLIRRKMTYNEWIKSLDGVDVSIEEAFQAGRVSLADELEELWRLDNDNFGDNALDHLGRQ